MTLDAVHGNCLWPDSSYTRSRTWSKMSLSFRSAWPRAVSRCLVNSPLVSPALSLAVAPGDVANAMKLPLPVAMAASPLAPGSRGAERVVAAGIQHQDAQRCAGSLDPLQHAPRRVSLVGHVGLLFRVEIDRDQVVFSLHLHAVAGVVEEGDVIGADTLDEGIDSSVEGAQIGVRCGLHLETELPERGRQGLGVMYGVAQGTGGIGRVADHQRDTARALRGGRLHAAGALGGEDRRAQSRQAEDEREAEYLKQAHRGPQGYSLLCVFRRKTFKTRESKENAFSGHRGYLYLAGARTASRSDRRSWFLACPGSA